MALTGESQGLSPLLERIDAAAHEYKDHPAILGPSISLTHGELQAISLEVAGFLQSQGIRKGDRIALYAQNGPEFVAIYLGIVRSGAVVVPVNLLIQTPEIVHIIRDAGVSGIITQESLDSKVREAHAIASSDAFILTFAESNDPLANLAPLRATGVDVSRLSFDPKEDLVAILYTSGTTGFPKGAMLTHSNLASNTQSVHEAMCWRRGTDRVLVVLPMFHAFAATVGILTPLTNGSALIPVVRFEPDAVSLAIQRYQATIFLGVPSIFGVLLKLPEDRVARFSSLRFAISGGAALPVVLLESFQERFGLRIYEGDGPTECSPVTCVNPIGGIQKPGTVGLPVPGVEMRIVDDSGDQCQDGVVGEIAVRGPNVMKGYWNQPEETAAIMQGEWLLTGDLGMRDSDGYFSIVDRKKDLIIVNGMNVYPRMVEEILHAISGVREVAVIGEVDDRHGEVPVAYVALETDAGMDARQLRDHCRLILGRHQMPKRFVILEALPRNAAGKILKRELRRQGELERGIDLQGAAESITEIP